VSDPENRLVHAFAANLCRCILRVLLSLREATNSDPVVSIRAVNLTTEAKRFCSRHNCQALDGLLETKSVVFTEANAGPIEHLGFLREVGDAERLVLGKKDAVLRRDQIIDLVEKVLAAANPILSF